MKIFGIAMMAFSVLFFLGALHALKMYGIQGDPRWFMSIIFCPVMGGITAMMGLMFVRS